MDANTGGFEAVKVGGFHRTFDEWTRNRLPTTTTTSKSCGDDDDANSKLLLPAPCVGEYTHMRPKEDWDVFQRIEHIPVSAGDAVFWDYRIPHANAYRHDGSYPRIVVYCSFLPDVELNRRYVANQLEDFRVCRPPRDQWNHIIDDVDDDDDESVKRKQFKGMKQYVFTKLGRKLMGMDAW